MGEIKKWENQLLEFAPEICDMCKGWAQGAADIGIEMSYLDVLEIWTGHMPPKKTYMGRGDKISDVPPPIACSGAGAWGRATPDGKLVTGSSGDHDPSFPLLLWHIRIPAITSCLQPSRRWGTLCLLEASICSAFLE